MEVKSDLHPGIDVVLLRFLKRFFVVVIGSGLITNALYVYGLAYYQGYIEGFGFDFALFPLQWGDALLWTYYASIDLGVSTVSFWKGFDLKAFLLLFFAVYLLSRMWMAAGAESADKKEQPNKIRYKFLRFLVKIKIKFPRLFSVLYPSMRWLLMKEQSFWAFVASYFFLAVLFFIPMFIFIWIYFPLIGLNHGGSVAEQQMVRYEKGLCGDNGSYWNKCLEISVSANNVKKPKKVIGRLVVRDKSMIGIYTEDGPVTMTMPKDFYYKGIKWAP